MHAWSPAKAVLIPIFALIAGSCGSSGTETKDDVTSELAEGECTSWEQCSDSNPCTKHECVEGMCVTTPLSGKICDDESVCTVNDQCNDEGACVGELAIDCDDDNPCTADICDPVTGCVSTNLEDETACDDGQGCTVDDLCIDGECHAGEPRICEDGDPNDCIYYECDPDVGDCTIELFVEEGGVCSDGDPCTDDDSCDDQGVCVSGEPHRCKTMEPCKDSYCNSEAAEGADPCVVEWGHSGDDCDDLDVCTILDVCVPIVGEETLDCTGIPLECNTLDECKEGLCQTGVGCVFENSAEGLPCGPLPGWRCQTGACVCTPLCAGVECGDDGCGGECGPCAEGLTCWQTLCIPEGDGCTDGNEQVWDGCTNGQLSEFRLDPGTAGGIADPDVAVFANGDFVVTWEASVPLGDGGEAGIFARVYDADTTPASDVIRVDILPEGVSREPRVAVVDDDLFIIVWYDDKSSGDKVKGRMFHADGSSSGGQITISSGSGEHRHPAVAPHMGGSVVAWQRNATIGSDREVRLLRLGTSGVIIGDLHTADASNKNAFAPDVLSISDNRVVVAWEHEISNDNGESKRTVGLQRFDSGIASDGGMFLASASSTADGRPRPALARAPGNRFAVSWNASLYDPYGAPDVACRGFDDDGTPIGGLWTVNASEVESTANSDIATLADLGLVAVWEGDGDIWARLHESDLKVGVGPFKINELVAGWQGQPAVGGFPDGSFVVVWASGNSTETEESDALFARRFGNDGNPLFH